MIEVNYRNAFDEFGDMNEEPEEIYERYKDEIEKGEISKEVLEKIVASIVSVAEHKEYTIKRFIKNIYISIISLKYLCETTDIAQIELLIEAIYRLKSDALFSGEYDEFIKTGETKFYDFPKICKDIYEKIYTESIYGKTELMKPYGEEEEFDPKHLLDVKYYLKKFNEWGKLDHEFSKFLEYKVWRFI